MRNGHGTIKDHFLPGTIQACNTLEGQEHRMSSSKNNSSYKFMKIANKETSFLPPKKKNYVYNKKHLRNRISSEIPQCKESSCSLSITIFCSGKDEMWYLSSYPPKSCYDGESVVHTNHFPIGASDLCISQRSQLPKECYETIEKMLIEGVPVSSIIKCVQLIFKINLTSSIVQNMRTQILNELHFLLDTHSSNDATAASKLINLLKSSDNVSYVILKHHINSGFVTYSSQGKDEEKKLVSMDSNSKHEVEMWRKELVCDEKSTEILVSCAWCHDHEKRKITMFPEYLAFDTTFGLNRQRRSLFLAVGIDGRNEIFSAFRCWMPSKQRAAFFWTISQAMPFLFGPALRGKHKVISSDSELSLVQAIKGSINSPSSQFTNAKFRTDYFHFFEIPWKKLKASVDSSDAKFLEASEYVKIWIKSWFRYIQSKKEFDISHERLIRFMQKEKEVLGKQFCIGLRNIILQILGAKDDLVHYMFLKKTSFGFLGSSIVEAMNSSTKNKGLHSIQSNMSMSHSTLCQLKQTENIFEKQNQNVAKSLNSSQRYIQFSALDDVIEKYMLDIAAKNYDGGIGYYVRQVNKSKFWCLRRNIHDDQYEDNLSIDKSPVAYFDRVYEIILHESKFLTCSCGYVHQYMAPCMHVMAVLSDEENIRPTLFHYRYWKAFHYFYLKDFGESSIMSDNSIVAVKEKLKEWKSFVEVNAFHKNGEYKGCYVEKDIVEKLQSSQIEEDDVYCTMEKLSNYVEEVGPVLRKSQNFLLNNESDIDSSNVNDLLPLNSEMTMDSHLSQPTEFELEIQRQNVQTDSNLQTESDNDTSKHNTDGVQRGSDTWNNTMDAMDLIRNEEDEIIWNEFCLSFKFKRAAVKVNGRIHDTSIVGSELSDFRKARKRHKQSYE